MGENEVPANGSPPKDVAVYVQDSQDVHDIRNLPTPEKMMDQDSQSFHETPATTEMDSEEEKEKILRLKTLELGGEVEDVEGEPQQVIPASQPRPESPDPKTNEENNGGHEVKEPVVEEPEVREPEVEPEKPPTNPPSQHHILDEFAEKVLTRADQDKLRWGDGDAEESKDKSKKGGRKGKGRGKGKKGKGRGRGRGRGKGRGPPGKTTPKPKTRISSKAFEKYVGETKRNLSPKFDEAMGDEDWTLAKDKAETTPKSTKGPSMKRPATKAKAKAKAKASQKPKGSSVPSAVSGIGGEEEKPKKRAKTSGDGGVDASAGVKKRGNPGLAVPTFSHCTLVPYWSRNAVALKMPIKDDGASSSGLTQAIGGYVCFGLFGEVCHDSIRKYHESINVLTFRF